MTGQLRYRIDRDLIKKAEKVCKEIGLAPSQAVSVFFSQLVKLRAMPFQPSEFLVLEEYGATLADSDAAEARALKEIEADLKAGKVFQFTGKLP